jgi:hypothetical protein
MIDPSRGLNNNSGFVALEFILRLEGACETSSKGRSQQPINSDIYSQEAFMDVDGLDELWTLRSRHKAFGCK